MSIIETYGEDLTKRNYVTNPAIKREDEIRKLMMVLLTPDKSGLLVGKASLDIDAFLNIIINWWLNWLFVFVDLPQ